MNIWRGILSGILMNGFVPGWAFAQERSYDWGWGMHPMWWMGGPWGIVMMFMMFLFWILVIVGIVLAVRWLVREDKERRSDSALEILRQRYARGEINKEESKPRKKI